MTEASENNSLPENEPTEPSPELSPTFPKVTLKDMTQSHRMLVAFLDAVREAQYPGNKTYDIALGLDFLQRMINTSRIQLESAKKEEKDMIRRTKDAIKEAGGQMTTEAPSVGSESAAS